MATTLGPVLRSVAQNFGATISNNPAVAVSTAIALVAQACLNTLAHKHEMKIYQPIVQLTSAALGAGAAYFLGLTVAPELLLAAILAPIVIRYVAAFLVGEPQDKAVIPEDYTQIQEGQLLVDKQQFEDLKKRPELQEGQTIVVKAEVDEQLKALNEQIKKLTENYKTLEAKHQALVESADASTAQSNVATLQTEKTQLEEGMANLKKELEAKQAEVAEAKQALAGSTEKLSAELNQAKARVTELTKELEAAEANAADSEKLTQAQDRVAELTQELEAAKANAADSEELNQAEAKVAELTQELEDANAQVAELTSAQQELNDKITELEEAAKAKSGSSEHGGELEALVKETLPNIAPNTPGRTKKVEAFRVAAEKLVNGEPKEELVETD